MNISYDDDNEHEATFLSQANKRKKVTFKHPHTHIQ